MLNIQKIWDWNPGGLARGMTLYHSWDKDHSEGKAKTGWPVGKKDTRKSFERVEVTAAFLLSYSVG